FADYKDRLRAIRLEKSEKGLVPKDVWQSDGAAPYMSTPALDGDLLFGASVRGGGTFFCLDPQTGTTLWEAHLPYRFGYAAVVTAGGAWLFLPERARLFVARPSARAYEPAGDYQFVNRPTWALPVFLGERILIRDDQNLRSHHIEPYRK